MNDFNFSKKDLLSYFSLASIVILLNIFLLYTKQFGLIFFLIFIIISFLRNKDLPLIPLLTVLLLVTNIFEFASLEQMPFIQSGPGMRFNLLDIISVSYLFFLWNRIINITNTPSKWFVNFVLITSILYVFIGFIFTLTPRGAWTRTGFNSKDKFILLHKIY